MLFKQKYFSFHSSFQQSKLFFLLSILISTNVMAQSIFNQESLQNDLDNLVYQIEAAHPNPYYRISKQKFYKEVKKVKSTITKPMTYMEFYFIAQRLVSKLEDGHIDINMPLDLYNSQPDISFPFTVQLNVRKPYITAGKSTTQNSSEIAFGAEILAINHLPAKKIVMDIVSLVSGETAKFRASYGAKYFDFYINQLYPKQASYQINYRYRGAVKTKELTGQKKK